MGYDDAEISIVITDDEDIRNLNRNFRGKDKSTNVLSFPMMDDGFPEFGITMLGDIVISEETALREAETAKISLSERTSQLLVHGILHLIGYDHELGEEEENKMISKSSELIDIVEKNKNISHWM